MSLQEALVALDHRFWDAAGDGAFYREHTAEDGLCILPVGMLDKAQTLDAIERAEPWLEHRFADVSTIRHGEASATLCYRAYARRAGATECRAAVSTTYDRLAGRWRLAVHQQTPLAA